MGSDEREFVRWLRQAAGCVARDDVVGIGDDMATLLPPGTVLVTCDMLLEGVHFDSHRHTWCEIGRKAAGCGLSDCAAMAVQPVAATVSLAWPRDRDVGGVRELMGGVIDELGAFACALIGGDTTRWPHPLAIDVSLFAYPYPGMTPVRRDGARAGDGVYVTGPLGGSILGKHMTFTPRVHEARAIATALGARLHAMMDITDGLAIDLDRIAEASGVGAVLAETLVLAAASDAARTAARSDGRSARDHVLADGEDFELLIVGDVREQEVKAFGLLHVGEMVDQPGLALRSADGAVAPLAATGYRHL